MTFFGGGWRSIYALVGVEVLIGLFVENIVLHRIALDRMVF